MNCKKSNSGLIDVSQITHLDYNGNLTSTADNTDWTLDLNWTKAELELFETPTAAQLANTASGNISSIFGYPNPITTQQILYIKSTTNALLEIVVTDNMLSVKKRTFVNISDSTMLVSMIYDQSIFTNHTNYRVYYGFYSLTEGMFYKGHGDIRIDR